MANTSLLRTLGATYLSMKKTDKHHPGRQKLLTTSAVSGLSCIVLGAFGAHALQTKLDASALSVWQTAVHYQMFQTLALFGVAILLTRTTHQALLTVCGYFFALGIVLFCGSLYLLAWSDLRWLGAITPLGGLCFIIGWTLLLMASVRK